MDNIISIVIPAYNEEDYLYENIISLHKYMKKLKRKFEIIIVNDGSKDNTQNISLKLSSQYKFIYSIHNEMNRGKGYSIKKGVLAAKGEYIFFMDADLSTPLDEIEIALKIMESTHSEILIGSRSKKNTLVKQPLYRSIMGRTFSFLTNLLLPLSISDTQCGFKCFKKEIAYYLFPLQTMERFSFDVELLYLAKKNGFRIFQMPVRWENNEKSTVKPFLDSFRMFRDLLKIRIIHNKKW